MRLLVQRVKQADVTVEGEVTGKIAAGLLLFFGLHQNDNLKSIPWLVNKVSNLRIFSDSEGKMNLSVKDVQGSFLVVSQFTLYGNCMNGRRPDFIETMRGKEAEELYHAFVNQLKNEGVPVETGVFGADMAVSLINDGPVTFLIETP